MIEEEKVAHTASGTAFATTALRGHKAAVTSLDLGHDHLLASASEDCSVRLWDLRTHRAVQGCTGAFTDAVNIVRFNRHNTNSVLCCSERSLYEIDLRQGMIIREAQELVSMDDDISSFDVHPKNANMVAVADDSGVARIVDIASKRVVKHLHHVHSNICSSVMFRPNAQWDLITAAMDGILCHWLVIDRSPWFKFMHARATCFCW